MKRKELEAALKVIGEEQADRLKALTSAFSKIDLKSLECAPVAGSISAALHAVIPVSYSETDLQSALCASLSPLANAAREVVAAGSGEIDPRLHESFRLGLVESSLAAAWNNFLEDEGDEPESATLASVNDGSQEAKTVALLQPKVVEPEVNEPVHSEPVAASGTGTSVASFHAPEPSSVPNDRAHEAPTPMAVAGKPARTWKNVEICFLDAEQVQVTEPDQVRRLSYAEMGFGDRRGVQVGDRGPNQAWGWLRRLAEEGGTINITERRSSPAPKGPDTVRQPRSAHEALINQKSPATMARDKLRVALRELRKHLRSHFGIEDQPILFEQTRYRAQFRIGLSSSYHN